MPVYKGETKGSAVGKEASILRQSPLIVAGVGTKTETRLSLGPESARLRSRRGDSHF
jgi:hypothetical protein